MPLGVEKIEGSKRTGWRMVLWSRPEPDPE